MNGSELVWNLLDELGVRVVFGVPGGAVLPLVDALSAHEDRMPFVVCRHESAAIHAADGYARAAGKPGVALVTSGPGGTNVVTGLATALSDSVPLVLILGQVSTRVMGTDAFQEADLFGMTMPVVKHSWRVTDPEDVESTIREAFWTAQHGRPGPVVVELPKDIQGAEVDFPQCLWVAPREPGLGLTALDRVRLKGYLKRAKQPLLYVGGGVTSSDTGDLVCKIAERLAAPVTTTLMGLGAFPSEHPLSLGMLGMHGTWTANHAMQEADLVLAFGVRFDDRVTGLVADFAPKARIVHLEVDPAEVNKIVTADITLLGDLRQSLRYLADLVPSKSRRPWMDQLNTWQSQHPVKVPAPEAGTLAAGQVLGILQATMDPDDPVITEVGQHQMWAALCIGRNLPRRFITSGGVGTMGYGFPAAMGAQMACPDRRAVLVAGDGSFQMNLQELATLVQYRIPIVIVILNNQGHGMVRQWQDLFHGKRRYGVKLQNPDFVLLASAYGIPGYTVNSLDAFEEAFREAYRGTEGPSLIEVVVDPNEMVFPMVPQGHSLSTVLEF